MEDPKRIFGIQDYDSGSVVAHATIVGAPLGRFETGSVGQVGGADRVYDAAPGGYKLGQSYKQAPAADPGDNELSPKAKGAVRLRRRGVPLIPESDNSDDEDMVTNNAEVSKTQQPSSSGSGMPPTTDMESTFSREITILEDETRATWERPQEYFKHRGTYKSHGRNTEASFLMKSVLSH